MNLRDKFFELIAGATETSPILESEVAAEMGLKNAAQLRAQWIAPLRREGVPIGSNANGIFLATTAEQLEGTKAHLKSRCESYYDLIRGVELAQTRLRCGYDPRNLQGKLL